MEKRETTPTGNIQYEYVYDSRGRLSQVLKNGVFEHIYGYDGNSNRISVNGQVVGVYDAQDRLQSYNGTQYIYNLNGDLESKIHSQGQDQFVYDSYGNLTRVDLSAGVRLDYIIDGQGRRVAKLKNGIRESGFLYLNQLKPVAELNADNSIRSFFIYGLNPNVPAYMLRNGVRYQIHTDQLGSVRFVVDSSGVVVQEIEYDVWGKVIKDTNPGFQPFGFAGGIYDIDTGLVRFGARDYDPEVGRWTSKDPILFAGGDTNLYGYVLSDPVNLIDPDGLRYRVCSRPLSGAPGQIGSIRHDYLQFDNGDTYSFGPAPGESRFGGISSNIPESGKGAQCTPYSQDSSRDAEIRRRAEQNFLRDYHLRNFNCQDFVRDSIGGR